MFRHVFQCLISHVSVLVYSKTEKALAGKVVKLRCKITASKMGAKFNTNITSTVKVEAKIALKVTVNVGKNSS